jgi:hypothetical protein
MSLTLSPSKYCRGLVSLPKTESNKRGKNNFAFGSATVHTGALLQPRRQTTFGGERGCKIAPHLSSNASIGRESEGLGRPGEEGAPMQEGCGT